MVSFDKIKKTLFYKIFITFVLGINSGLPIVLTASTMKLMLAECDISIEVIGVFGLVAIPYSLKFLIAPFIDNKRVPLFGPLLGRLRSWILLAQILLTVFIYLFSIIDPVEHLYSFALLAFLISTSSAIQDAAIDAYRIKIFNLEEQGVGVSSSTYGYRMGMLISGAGALVIAEKFSWSFSYLMMAIALMPGMLILFFGPKVTDEGDNKISFKEYVVKPLSKFVNIERVYFIILLLLFYKLSDAYLGAMTYPFIFDMGYTKGEIAYAVKSIGLTATLFGMFVGAYIVLRVKTGLNLFFSEILAMLSNLPFLLLTILPKDVYLLAAINGFENFASSISNVAIMAYMSNLSKSKYVATFYAIFTSIITIGRTGVAASSGYLVKAVGWQDFFVISAFLSLPCLLIIYILFWRKNVSQ